MLAIWRKTRTTAWDWINECRAHPFKCYIGPLVPLLQIGFKEWSYDSLSSSSIKINPGKSPTQREAFTFYSGANPKTTPSNRKLSNLPGPARSIPSKPFHGAPTLPEASVGLDRWPLPTLKLFSRGRPHLTPSPMAFSVGCKGASNSYKP